jgi:hypothetical protein
MKFSCTPITQQGPDMTRKKQKNDYVNAELILVDED